MLHLRADVEVIDDERGDAFHSLIARRAHEPSGPSTLARAGDDELGDRVVGVFGEGLNRIHRFDRALRHREEQRPGRVAGLEVLFERVGDQVVFRHPPEWLVWDVEQDCGRKAGLVGHGFEEEQVVRAGLTAGDEQHRRPLRKRLRRVRDDDIVLPVPALPSLTGEVDLRHSLDVFDAFPREGRLRSPKVVLKGRWFGRGGEQGNEHRDHSSIVAARDKLD